MSDLRSLLLAEMSRRNTDFIRDIVLSNKALFDELFKLTLLNEEPISRRAMWVVDVASETEPEILLPYINDLINALPGFYHDGLKRHTLRMLSRYDLGIEEFLPILDLCFKYMRSEKESVAVRYQAMHLLYKMSEKEPGLKHEIISTIELQMHDGSSGLGNQCLKLRKKLKDEINNLQ
ncbi:MAG: hypothetical protein V2I62_02010 [Bacteroidales bacterium]|jgi:hypothetical protein|nr:hypothetical protein [Bacteroidales bacterium]